MKLSHFAIDRAKSKPKPYRLSDGDGLSLLIQPSGSKLWQLRFRHSGKENILSFGKYPYVGLAEAREKRTEAKRLLASGTNPAAQKKLDRIIADDEAKQTFGVIADEYIDRMKERGAADATLSKTTWLLKNLAKPIENRPVREIHPKELLDLLQTIEKSGRRETARRLRGTMSGVFKLAIFTLRADTDPTAPILGALIPPRVQSRAAIVEEDEFGAFLNTLDEYDGWATITAALKFLILTCVRPGEVRGAVRAEFNLEKAVWTVPAERMKMRQPHKVPLSRQALEILEDVWPLSEAAELVFPSIRSNKRPLSENAFNSAMRRMGYSKDQVTAHGFRSTASTLLNDREYNPDVIEAVLAHQDGNSVRRTYNRATYWSQRVELMQEWADLLDQFRAESA